MSKKRNYNSTQCLLIFSLLFSVNISFGNSFFCDLYTNFSEKINLSIYYELDKCTELNLNTSIGKVWEDWNYNGIQDESPVTGVSQITVNVYDCAGNLLGSPLTDNNGDWTLDVSSRAVCGGCDDIRVEYSNLPNWAKPTQAGTNNGTTVQFVDPTAAANLGVARPLDYCQSNPDVILACYENGNADWGNGVGNSNKGIIQLDYNSSGSSQAGTMENAKIRKVGTICNDINTGPEKQGDFYVFDKNSYIDNSLLDKSLLSNSLINQSGENTFHLLSHGQTGQLLINHQWLSGDDLAAFIQPLLKDKTHLNIYGCYFAQGEKGRAAVDYLEAALGISVAASDDLTGIDGDWELEVGTGLSALSFPQYQYSLQCDCSDMIYLNDPQANEVHKFSLDAIGQPSEIGSPWLSAGGVNNAHGLGVDLNGFLYIGEETMSNLNVGELTGPVKKLSCDGTILDHDYLGPNTEITFNFGSYNGILYMPDNGSDEIVAYSLCDGSELGRMNITTTSEDIYTWGFYTDETNWYVANRNTGNVFTGLLDISLFNTPAANAGGYLFGTGISNGGNITQGNGPMGITKDDIGNIYIVMNSFAATHTGQEIRKYSPTGVLLASVSDNSFSQNTGNGIAGFYGARGITYSSLAGHIYVAAWDNCIAVLDTNLNEIPTLNIGNPNNFSPKGISINRECCPVNNNISIDTTLCGSSVNDKIFLQELVSCQGVICEGFWAEGASNTGLTYNSCDNSITIDALNACGSFTLEKTTPATGQQQCGQFSIEVNIIVNSLDITVNQISCTDNNDGTFTSNHEVIVNWNSEPCNVGEMINITHNGMSIGVIDPNTDSSPSTFPLSVSASGNGTNLINAEFTISNCSDNTSFKTPAPCPTNVAPCASTAGCIGGNVFEDFNCNGADDTNEPGVQGIQINIYDCNNSLIGTSYSDSDGDWQVCGLTNGTAYRIEHILPETVSCWATPTHVGSDNMSDVQFLTAPACTQFSVSSPTDYCQANPQLITPCYVNGAINGTGLDDVLVKWSYDNSGTSTGDKTKIGTKSQMGATWGVAYARNTQTIYASTVLKRHVGLLDADNDGNGDLGAIYQRNINTGVPTLFMTIPNVGTIGNDAARGLGNSTAQNQDATALSKVMKTGLGDIDISDDNETLYVTNLFEKTLIEIDIASQMITNTYQLPNPCNTADGTNRPFGIGVEKGIVYIGMVCDASISGDVNDLSSSVYRLDGGHFSQVINFPLNYDKEVAAAPQANVRDGWFPWSDDYEDLTVEFSSTVRVIAPTPVLSDIDFDAQGNMVMAFIDRTGFIGGGENATPFTVTHITVSDPNLENITISGGDILRATPNSTSGYNIEPNPGTGEFFDDDSQIVDHDESFVGGLVINKITNEAVSTAYDPVPTFHTGGVVFNNLTTGLRTDSYLVYDNNTVEFFGKGTGLGDIEMACNPAPLEIGNYVWCDSLQNGIQDACERGISDIIVQLYDRNGILVGQDTTVNGQYYFNQNNVDTTGITVNVSGITSPVTTWSGMSYSTQYFIVFGGGQFTTDEFTIGSDMYGITPVVNAGSNDNIDSDVDGNSLTSGSLGARPNGLPFIDMMTSPTGCGDHKYDLGVTCEQEIDYPDYVHPTNTCITPVCHIVNSSLYLGEGVTIDDTYSANQSADLDVDDGISILPNMSFIPGNTIHLPVNIYNASNMDAYLRIWIDWNGDGDFEDTGEQVENNIYPSTGNSNKVHISITIPVSANKSQALALRARLSTDDANSAVPCANGNCAADGEVEDYLLQVDCPAPFCPPVQLMKKSGNP